MNHLIVVLHDPSELFGLKPEAMLESDARLEPGADQMSTSCLAGRVQRQDRIIVMLPASEITDGVAENLHLALRRYCESRLTLVQRETHVAWRQGLRSLGRRRPFTA